MKISLALLCTAFGDDFHGDLKKTNTRRLDINPDEYTESYWRTLTKKDIHDGIKKKRIEKK